MAIGGGYLRYNHNPNLKLGAWLTGTTFAWYTMPGWEIGYLSGAVDVGGMNPIALGDAFTEYHVTGQNQAEILRFLDNKKQQVIKIAEHGHKSVSGRNTVTADDYFSDAPLGAIQFTHLGAAFAEIAVPPTTYMRQALLTTGMSFVGMANDGGAFDTLMSNYGLIEGLASLVGLSPTEKLMEHSGSKRNKIVLMIQMGGGYTANGITWHEVPLVNGKASFGLIADKLRNTKVRKYTPSAAYQTTKKQVKKSGFLASLQEANKTLGRFI